MRKEIWVILVLLSVLLVFAFAVTYVLTMTDAPAWFVNLFIRDLR